MKYFFAGLLLLFSIAGSAQSFSRYLVRFKNKSGTPYTFANPSQYLSQRAIDRRTQYGIALDSTDLPVTPRYVDSVRLAGNVTILNVSRWLNQVSIQTTDTAALQKISSFSFVQSATAIAARVAGEKGAGGKQSVNDTRKKAPGKKAFFKPEADVYNYGSSYPQIHIHNGEFLHNIGLRGQGMVLTLHDGGFYHYNTLKAFDSVNAGGQVLGVHDFVAKDNSVIEDDAHGMECFSVIAANIPGQFVGSAPKASFYLFRTEEDATEYPIEEHNWVCGAERADSAGSDVISSSLGYTTFDNPAFDHTYAQLDGNTTIAAIGADLAAKKGLLVVLAAGNEGDNSWGKIGTPADADSALAVGAVNASGVAASFTSRGPSADGQVKPDVVSVGVRTTVQAPNNTIATNNGTSFSTPNIAGLATCLWQGFREFNNMKIIQALRQAGNRYTTPNDTTGYGLPDMRKAVLILLKDFFTATVTAGACKNTISWTSKDAAGMRYEIERKTPSETTFAKVGEKSATGVLFSQQRYSIPDSLMNVQAGTITYRIRQVIDTSIAATVSADYIDTVSVSLAASCITTSVPNVPVTSEDFTVLPNPASATVSLRITTLYTVPQLTIRILDGKGSAVMMKQTSKAAGTSTVDFQVSRLAKGKYYMAVYAGEQRLATKEFMKL